MTSTKLWAAAMLLIVFFTTVSYARPNYVALIPNGNRVPNGQGGFVTAIGHSNPSGGGSRNSFGEDFSRFGRTWNQQLCQADSDGDGLTNGQELGDPTCVWTVGATPTRTVNITHPGNSSASSIVVFASLALALLATIL